MLERLKNLLIILSICLMMSGLSGCESVPANDFCLVDSMIVPTNAEINAVVEADQVELLLRIDEHDTIHEDLCKK